MKKMTALALCLAVLCALTAPALAAGEQTIEVSPIDVMVGGEEFLPTDANGNDVPIFVCDGTTYAPMRALAEAYGLTVSYDAGRKLACISGAPSGRFEGSRGREKALTRRTRLRVSSIDIMVNGEVFCPKDANGKSVPVFVYNGTTYAPIRAVAEAYGLTVSYDAQRRLARVDFVPQSAAVTGYDPVIDHYNIPFDLGSPRYTLEEIRRMVAEELTLEEAAERLSTLADVIQYLHQRGYMPAGGENRGDLQIEYGGVEWHLNRSAQTVFDQNQGNCGGGSNLINYLLQGDFDEQGYVQESANQGGHIYNYFKQDGLYYFFDMVQIVHGGDYAHRGYEVYVTAEPQEFSRWYVNRGGEDTRDPHYLWLQYMYARDGESLPIGSNRQCRTELGRPFMNLISDELGDTAVILYVGGEKYTPLFRTAPDRSLWPAIAR